MLVHWLWFSFLPKLNGRQKLELLDRYRSPEDIYLLDRKALLSTQLSPGAINGLLNKDLAKAQSVLKACGEKGIGILAFFDSAYPNRLRGIDDPPMVLYYRGKMQSLELQPVIGVVGTREASTYGLRSASKISAQIAACGGIVVSGGALGIDTVALQGALDMDQKTVAVLAGGLDKVYPRSNETLFDKVMEKGCLLSEYPPGEPAYKGNFLRRNRIISGISNGVLVVEAPKVSGALNTARWAWSQGRDVFAVPGNIDVASCEGSNELIGDIAKAALSGWAVMKEYEALYPGAVKRVEPELSAPEMLAQETEKPEPRAKADKITVDKQDDCPYSVIENVLPTLSQQERAVVAVLTKEPVPVDQVMGRLSLPSGTVLSIITKLALKGVVKNHPGKLISLN